MPFTHILKGIGGQFELGRVLWAFSALSMVVYQGVAIGFNHQNFSPVEFGAGCAAILAAGGFGIAAKDKGVARAVATSEGAA